MSYGNPWALPTTAEELTAYVERVGGIHLHNGNTGWRLVHIETGKCGTPECAKLRLATQRPADQGMEEA